jgi:hypothetical protein
MGHFKGQEANFALDMPASIIEIALLPGTLATGDLPGFEELPVGIEQLIALRPTHDEANTMLES